MCGVVKSWIERIRAVLRDEAEEMETGENLRMGKGDDDGIQEKAGKIIAFMSGKGGVGKTGIAVNVANFCAKSGKKVLLVDCDMSTNGATAFFRTGKPDRFDAPGRILILQRVISAYSVNENIARGPISLMEKPIYIDKNYYFVPACVEDGIFDEGLVTEDLLQRLETDYFAEWKKSYDVIILDFGAGAAKLTVSLAELPDKICIVMNPDGMSRQVVRTKLRFVFQKCNLNNIICCINKLKRSDEQVNVSALFNEFPGFVDAKDYRDCYVAGKLIEPTNAALWKRLSSIADNVYEQRTVTETEDL